MANTVVMTIHTRNRLLGRNPIVAGRRPAEHKIGEKMYLDAELVAQLQAAENEWMRKAFEDGCPTCGLKLRELPEEANIFPHMTGACKAT